MDNTSNLETLLSSLISSNVGVLKALSLIQKDQKESTEKQKELSNILYELKDNQRALAEAQATTTNILHEYNKQVTHELNETKQTLEYLMSQLDNSEDENELQALMDKIDSVNPNNSLNEMVDALMNVSQDMTRVVQKFDQIDANLGVTSQVVQNMKTNVDEMATANRTVASRLESVDVRLASVLTPSNDISLDALQAQVEELNNLSSQFND